MSDLSWAVIVRLVRQRASRCCEYCQTCEDTIGQTPHIDHIDPGDGDHPDNLCLACPTCNLSKGQATSAIDPQTGELVGLFNPRQQVWADHFVWVEDGLQVQGLTPTGRATVSRLHMNQTRLLGARSLWIRANCHPPKFAD